MYAIEIDKTIQTSFMYAIEIDNKKSVFLIARMTGLMIDKCVHQTEHFYIGTYFF